MALTLPARQSPIFLPKLASCCLPPPSLLLPGTASFWSCTAFCPTLQPLHRLCLLSLGPSLKATSWESPFAFQMRRGASKTCLGGKDEVEAGRSLWIPGQSGLCSETLLPKKQQQKVPNQTCPGATCLEPDFAPGAGPRVSTD